jgi:hypothetical protein
MFARSLSQLINFAILHDLSSEKASLSHLARPYPSGDHRRVYEDVYSAQGATENRPADKILLIGMLISAIPVLAMPCRPTRARST